MLMASINFVGEYGGTAVGVDSEVAKGLLLSHAGTQSDFAPTSVLFPVSAYHRKSTCILINGSFVSNLLLAF